MPTSNLSNSATLREATPADASALAACFNAAVQAGAVMLDGLPRSEAQVYRFLEGLGEREACLLLIHRDAIVGWGIVRRYSDRAGYRFCGETFVYVVPPGRRKGYGTQLQQALVARCHTYHYHHLLARIWASNAESLTFHQQAGYEVVGVQREIASIQGQWHDLVVLQRVLDEVSVDDL